MTTRERRPRPDDDEAEPGAFGCPMLAPVHWERAVEANIPSRRCLIGWSLTDDLAIARCRATNAVIDCWKAHPERTPVVALDARGTVAQVVHRAAAD